MIKLLLLIALISVSSSYQTEEEALARIHTLQQTPFGRQILDSVMLQLETSDSLDRLIKTLEGLEDRYASDQKEDDATNRQFQDQCDVDIKSYDDDIAQTSFQQLQYEAKLEGDLFPNRAVQLGVEKAKIHQINEYQADLDELEKERVEQNEVYEQKLAEHREAARIIREAKAVISDNLIKPSLAEIKKKTGHIKINPQSLAFVQTSLKESIDKIRRNHKYTKSYAGLFKVLLTIASQSDSTADQGSVEQIIQLCQNLLDKIDNSSDLERFAEDKRVQAYIKHQHLLQRDINAAKSILADVQATLSRLNDQIDQINASLGNLEVRLNNIKDYRSQRYTECEEAAFEYKESRTQRDSHRQVVSDVIGLVNQHLRVLREALALRVAAGDNIQ
ncbi:hypothetical protein pb186bvf_012155 [Paramecium bursaria]